jgi:hypothetical protein
MKCEAVHCFDRASVRFAVYPDGSDGPRVLAEISEQALRDVFGVRGGAEDLIHSCEQHFPLLEAKALQRFRHDPGKAVLLDTRDMSFI